MYVEQQDIALAVRAKQKASGGAAVQGKQPTGSRALVSQASLNFMQPSPRFYASKLGQTPNAANGFRQQTEQKRSKRCEGRVFSFSHLVLKLHELKVPIWNTEQLLNKALLNTEY
jgi:hypothetical protein